MLEEIENNGNTMENDTRNERQKFGSTDPNETRSNPISSGTTLLPKSAVSGIAIAEFIDELRNSLRSRREDENLYRWLLENQENPTTVRVEKSKQYASAIRTVTLVAVQEIISRYYDVKETYANNHEDEPANEISVEIDYDKEMMVYESGFIALENKKNKARLMLQMRFDDTPAYCRIYSIEGSGEAALFIKRLNKRIANNNFYKNKTFTLIREYYGLVPKFIKPIHLNREDVIISSNIATEFQRNAINVFQSAQEYKANKIPTKRGILLEGPPGNGKSTIIKYLNTILEGSVTFIYVTDGSIQSASDIGSLFDMARNFSPCCVIIEDIDTIGLSREVGRSFTSELLAQLDGLEPLNNFVIVATTNYAELVDDALKNRPNRFDRRLHITLPNETIRKAMFTKFLKEADLEFDEIVIETIVGLTKEFSGAHLKEIIYTAKMAALDDKISVEKQHLVDAVKFIRAQTTDGKISSENNTMGFRR